MPLMWVTQHKGWKSGIATYPLLIGCRVGVILVSVEVKWVEHIFCMTSLCKIRGDGHQWMETKYLSVIWLVAEWRFNDDILRIISASWHQELIRIEISFPWVLRRKIVFLNTVRELPYLHAQSIPVWLSMLFAILRNERWRIPHTVKFNWGSSYFWNVNPHFLECGPFSVRYGQKLFLRYHLSRPIDFALISCAVATESKSWFSFLLTSNIV